MFKVQFGDKIIRHIGDGQLETALFICQSVWRPDRIAITGINADENNKPYGSPFTDLAENWSSWPHDWDTKYDLEGGIEKIKQGQKQIAKAVKALKPIWEPEPEIVPGPSLDEQREMEAE